MWINDKTHFTTLILIFEMNLTMVGKEVLVPVGKRFKSLKSNRD
jgi:hypothetical protein